MGRDGWTFSQELRQVGAPEVTFLGAQGGLSEIAAGLETEILPVGGGVDGPVGATTGGNPPTILAHVWIPDNVIT